MERITLQTIDKVSIVGDFYATVSEKGPGVLMLHMMPTDRSSWRSLAESFMSQGFNVLAIDLRGHGESVEKNGQPLTYHNFNDSDHQASRLDVETALDWLQRRGIKEESLVIIGASIGANLALNALAKHPSIPAAVALSPGLDYRGVLATEAIAQLHSQQRVFLIASREDEYSAESAQKLYALAPSVSKDLKLYQNAGHGTAMLAAEPTLARELVEWIKTQLIK